MVMPKENIAIGGTDTVTDRDCIPIVENLVKQVVWLYLVCYKNGSIYIHRFIGFIRPNDVQSIINTI